MHRAGCSDKGVYVDMLCIAAAIENSAFHAEIKRGKAADHPAWETPAVDPEHLANLIWTMRSTKGQPEASYP